MTIAISFRVSDGVVLAADSASTLLAQTATGTEAVQVFNNANKIFNLRKGLPVGAITWGAGSIGRASTSTLMKDLRDRFSGRDSAHVDWHIDQANYTVLGVAERVKQFIYDECYVPTFQAWQTKPVLGFIVAGYSAGEGMAREYRIDIDAIGNCTGPVEINPDQCSICWNGEPEAITRLVLGFSAQLPELVRQALPNVPPDQVNNAFETAKATLQQATPLIYDPMPIQDAIDLADFLVELTKKFSRYTPGAATVGGPAEVAVITKHEGFKWVKRKHYFSTDLNPEESK